MQQGLEQADAGAGRVPGDQRLQLGRRRQALALRQRENVFQIVVPELGGHAPRNSLGQEYTNPQSAPGCRRECGIR